MDRWIDIAVWDEGARPVDAKALYGRDCFAGLDLSTTTDISAFVLVFPPEKDNKTNEPWKVLCRFWIPEDNVRKRVEKDRVPYDVWIRQGFIRATSGNVIDYEAIRQSIIADQKQFRIREIAFDRWNATQLCTQLDSDGFVMMPFGQGFASMSGPTKEVEKLIVGRQFVHGGNPVLRWMASNVAIKQDPAGNCKPDKSKSTERIDGIVALVMGVGRAALYIDRRIEYTFMIVG
jgi:phage terminase large subunit-like protein